MLLNPDLRTRHYIIGSPRHPRRWAAFRPNKVKRYQSAFGEDFCLVVTGDPSVPKDFYAMPWRAVSSYFVSDNVYPGPRQTGRASPLWKIHLLAGPAHHFQMELAPSDPRTRPRFDATQWFGNSDILGMPETTSPENALSEVDEDFTANEGREVFALHRRRERDPDLARRAKQQSLKKFGRLSCDVCEFDFLRAYGPLGEGFIEVHHLVPLRDLIERTRTTTRDLALVCANCHRMLHRGAIWRTVAELKAMFQQPGRAD